MNSVINNGKASCQNADGGNCDNRILEIIGIDQDIGYHQGSDDQYNRQAAHQRGRMQVFFASARHIDQAQAFGKTAACQNQNHSQ